VIPRDFVQTLLSRVDIVDVIQGYIPLKKGGANYMARCPFHDEKSASFSVSPTKQFYYCFGCGASGSAVGFVMEYAGMSFPEAVKSLAEQVGLPVPDDRSEPERPQAPPGESLHDFLQRAWDFYRNQLKDHPPAIDYLKRRGLTGQIAARFGLGYAPAGWRGLEAVMDRYDHPALVESGLVIEAENGKRYDRFRDRIMFPILDGRGSVIGFGGRIIDQGEPKYLNSPETPLFEKGRELYGLFQAKPAIREKSTVIVVEGYMDVVALAQHGVGYAVATLGTATTPHHIDRLLKLADRVVFSFDGDKAGRRAARRAFEVSLPQLKDGKDVGFLFLPAEHDPDSYIREYGAPAFENMLAEATPLSRFLIDEVKREHPEDSPEGRAGQVHQAVDWIAQVRAPALSMLMRQSLAESAGLPRTDIDALVSQVRPQDSTAGSVTRNPRLPEEQGELASILDPYRSSDVPFNKGAPANAAAWSSQPAKSKFGRKSAPKALGFIGRRETPVTLEETLIACLIQEPECVHTAHIDPADADLEAPALAAVADFIRSCDAPPNVAAFLEAFREGELGRVMDRAIRRILPSMHDTEPDQIKTVLQEGLTRLLLERDQRELARLIDAEAKGQATDEDRERLKMLLARRHAKPAPLKD
jgi:DNA primase